ncbi:hypothetical protein QUF80_17450 [Desulfococcaceae bacterium HSG8]|nr:hypothetical protein [Desulfococcaceae bacterium HSG8]
MDFKAKKKYYNRCAPYEPLDPDDERNVDLDGLGDETGDYVRGINWTEKLLNEITLSDQTVFKLFTGHPGSGKTTELRRLAQRLSDPELGNFLPVFINAEEVIDLVNPIEVTDIISAIVFSAEKTVIEAEGGVPETSLDEGYLKRFWNWLTNTDAELKQVEFEVASVGKLVYEMKTRPALRKRIRKTAALHFSRFIKDAKNELEMLNRRVKNTLKRDGMVIIFDSIEKLRGLTSNWHEVLASAEQVFSGGAPYIRLPVHVLYTVPAALATRMTGVEFLPMIKVCDKTKSPYPKGINAARELIRRRVPDDILKEIFGADAMAGRLEKLILRSGGYPREIVQILQMSIAQKQHPVSESAFEHILADIANQYRMIVTGESFAWLACVAKTKFLTIENDDHRQIADLMLANHAVLRYLNDALWFELHPAVYEIPGIQKAITDIESQ